jgi:transposase
MRDDGTIGAPTSKRPYFRPTTRDQRRLMFVVYEKTDSPRQACAAAHVCLGTFYRWRPRFLAGGYAALVEPVSHRPHSSPNQLPRPYVEEVLAAKREHPTWGKRRIADELAKDHGWQAVVSASQVRRVLIGAGLWPPRAKPAKKGDPSSATPTNRIKRSTSISALSRRLMGERSPCRRSVVRPGDWWSVESRGARRNGRGRDGSSSGRT